LCEATGGRSSAAANRPRLVSTQFGFTALIHLPAVSGGRIPEDWHPLTNPPPRPRVLVSCRASLYKRHHPATRVRDSILRWPGLVRSRPLGPPVSDISPAQGGITPGAEQRLGPTPRRSASRSRRRCWSIERHAAALWERLVVGRAPSSCAPPAQLQSTESGG
jgi:hypothetical protein